MNISEIRKKTKLWLSKQKIPTLNNLKILVHIWTFEYIPKAEGIKFLLGFWIENANL